MRIGWSRSDKMVAPFVVDSKMTRGGFLANLEQGLKPTLKRGDIVIRGNLPARKVSLRRKSLIPRLRGCFICRKFSPDLNPIEQAFSKWKARPPNEPFLVFAEGSENRLPPSAASECRNYFTHAGYVST